MSPSRITSWVNSLRSVKHEYLGGVVYAMAGATNAHNRIAGNVFGGLFSRLAERGASHCNSDTKVRIKLPAHIRFYYPDAMVVCRPNPPLDTFQDEPVVIVEVASTQTRRIDASEKKDAYLAIPSLEVYLLIEPGQPRIIMWRRGRGRIRPRGRRRPRRIDSGCLPWRRTPARRHLRGDRLQPRSRGRC